MKKIVFEGTDEQMGNLFKLVIANKDKNLPKIREDFQTENLWSVEDVKSNFNCTDEMALDILHKALTDNATMEQIWYAINHYAEENNLTKKEY
jgi:hypothetical protein